MSLKIILSIPTRYTYDASPQNGHHTALNTGKQAPFQSDGANSSSFHHFSFQFYVHFFSTPLYLSIYLSIYLQKKVVGGRRVHKIAILDFVTLVSLLAARPVELQTTVRQGKKNEKQCNKHDLYGIQVTGYTITHFKG